MPACSAPYSALTLLSCILDQLSFQSTDPLVDFVLNFSEGRFGVTSSPFFDVRQNVLAEFSPVVFTSLFHLPPPLHCCFFHLIPFLFGCLPSLQKDDGHPEASRHRFLRAVLVTKQALVFVQSRLYGLLKPREALSSRPLVIACLAAELSGHTLPSSPGDGPVHNFTHKRPR